MCLYILSSGPLGSISSLEMETVDDILVKGFTFVVLDYSRENSDDFSSLDYMCCCKGFIGGGVYFPNK